MLRTIVCWIGWMVSMACPPLWAIESLPERPNIIFIITDDQGYGELSCHGNKILKTPHLDRLHQESVRFVNFHVSPTCSPTRAALMTGQHEFRSGVTHTIMERERLSLKAVTVAELLKNNGYTTGIFGKWHLGDEDAYLPNQRGFEEVFIHGGGGIGQTYPGSCGDAPDNTYFDPAIWHNDRFVKTKGFCTDVFFQQATRWLNEKRNQKKPFFCMISTNAPHAPYLCPDSYSKPYLDKLLNKNEAAYYGMIANIDENIGQLMASLKDWDIEKKTLVIFMTDNGHPFPKMFNADMRGTKGTPYQGGVRVPCFWRWKDVLPQGVDVSALTAHVDFLPTLCELTGTKLPEKVSLDGRSLVPLLKDHKAKWEDRLLITHVGRWPQGKQADAKFSQCAIRNSRFKLVNNSELYDLQNDPSETTNLISKHPEVVTQLRESYELWWKEIQSALVNENVVAPAENPFKVRYWKQFGKDPK